MTPTLEGVNATAHLALPCCPVNVLGDCVEAAGGLPVLARLEGLFRARRWAEEAWLACIHAKDFALADQWDRVSCGITGAIRAHITWPEVVAARIAALPPDFWRDNQETS